MEKKLNIVELSRIIAIEYAHFLTTKCFYNIKGYMLSPDKLGDNLDQNEYEVDELFDYWFENIYLSTLK